MTTQASSTRDTSTLPARAFPSVLLALLALILILCASVGTGAYLYASATHLVSEYRRHLNSAADSAQLFFDQREVLLRTIAATAVRPEEITVAPHATGLQPLTTPNTDKRNTRELLLTTRYWQAIRRTGTLIYNQLHPAKAYRLDIQDGGTQWQAQSPALAMLLEPIDATPHSRKIPVFWLRQPDSADPRLVAYTPIDREDHDGGWLGLELSGIDTVLTKHAPPPGTEYTLFDIRGQAVLYSSAPPALQGQRWVFEDYFGFDEGWLPRHIILSKSIGTGGLRVLYTMPTSQLLRDGRPPLVKALLTLGVFTSIVLLCALLLHRRLLLPARRQQQNLLDSVSLNRKLVAMAPVGLALVNSDGTIVFQENEQARAWMDGDKVWRARLPQAHERQTHSEVTLKDGRTLRVNAIPLIYRGHQAALCSVVDVTTEKAEESALRQARQLAENANTAKTQFLTTMSHEIRTPLYGILGTLELMALSESPPQQASYLDTLRRSAETLFRVVGESLDLSRIEAGQITLEPREFCPQEQVDEVIAAFAANAQRKGLLLYAITPIAAITPVIGDPLKIRQILSNLVSNAIKFTTSGHVVLRLYTHTQPNGRVALRFQVTDSGNGISAEAIPKLFLPYFRLSDGTPEQPGTGLGLPICQHLASLMGGTLKVVSEPGLGTSITFEVVLPQLVSETCPAQPTLERLPVYVACDIPEITLHLCKWLRHWGAHALPYDQQAATPGAVLLHAWPSSSTPAPSWTERQVIVLPTGEPCPNEPRKPDVFHAASTAMRDVGQAVLSAQSQESSAPHTALPAEEPLRRQYVLVIDDNPINRQILEEQLSLLGCIVHLSSSGESALALPDVAHFDIVFTDLFMPDMDGYTFARALRTQGYRGRIIGITANAILDKDQEWQAAGMDALLIKPLPMAALRESLQPRKG